MNCLTFESARVAILLCTTTLLVACGGSNSDSETDPEPTSYTVSTSSNDGGTLSPNSRIVEEGATTTFTVDIDNGFMLVAISGCAGSLNDSVYETGPISQNCTVEATFANSDAAPSNFYAVAQENGVQLSWQDLDRAVDYDVLLATEAGITRENIDTIEGGERLEGVSPPVDVTDLMQDQDYYFVVYGNYALGNRSALSDEINVLLSTEGEYGGVLHLNFNDTGLDFCVDNSGSETSCPDNNLVGQDAEHGRDADARVGVLDKVGSGAAGFDYTKVDENGNFIAANSQVWSCVLDNHTGLTWQVFDSLHRVSAPTTTWYNPDAAKNGGYSGIQSEANTQQAVQDANNNTLCSYSNWRVPTRLELMSLVHHGERDPAIDEDYFPFTRSDDYWTATPYAGFDEHAWYIDFRSGNLTSDSKTQFKSVRLVRSPD